MTGVRGLIGVGFGVIFASTPDIHTPPVILPHFCPPTPEIQSSHSPTQRSLPEIITTRRRSTPPISIPRISIGFMTIFIFLLLPYISLYF